MRSHEEKIRKRDVAAEERVAHFRGSHYWKPIAFPVLVVRTSLQALNVVSPEKKRMILPNIQTRLNALERYNPMSDDSSIPF